MKIGYALVSTRDQNLDLQLRALKKAGCEKIFRERLSGFTRQRPEFQLDRLARSTRDLLNTMEMMTVFRRYSGVPRFGLATRSLCGVRFGRPRKLNPDKSRVACQLLADGKAVREIARTFNVHEATIYRLAAAS